MLACAQLPSKKSVSVYSHPTVNENSHCPSHLHQILISPFIFTNLMNKKEDIFIFYRFAFLWLLANLSMLYYIYQSFVFLWIAFLYYLPISLLDYCLIDLKAGIITLWYYFSVVYIAYIFNLLLVFIYIVLHNTKGLVFLW